MQNDFIASDGLIAREGRDVSQAQAMAKNLPSLLKIAREAGVFVVFVRNVYTTNNNFYLSDVWLEQAARKRHGGYTRIPVCAENSWSGDFYGDVRPLAGEPIRFLGAASGSSRLAPVAYRQFHLNAFPSSASAHTRYSGCSNLICINRRRAWLVPHTVGRLTIVVYAS